LSRDRPWLDVARLVAVVGGVVALGYAAGYGETVLIIVFLAGCIVAHELGHFVAAKTGGIKVTEFFFGFGPRLWSVRRGETEYGVKAIPLGGYCRIVGMNNLEEVDPRDEPRSYRSAPLWRRLLIDVAGSSAHFVIALVLLFAMFSWTGDDGHYLTSIPASNPIVQILEFGRQGSPAEEAGFRVGDRIVAIDGHRFSRWDQMAAFIQDHPGRRLDVTVEQGGRLVHLYPTPVPADTVSSPSTPGLPKGRVGVLGIGVSGVVHSGLAASVGDSAGAFAQTVTGTFSAIGHLVSFHGISSYLHMVTSQKAATTGSDRLVTVIGLPSVLHQAAQSGLPNVLWVVAVINISIGVFNLLPLFPLDGGRVAVALYEGLRSFRRPYRVDMAKLMPVMYLGLAIILFFALGSMLIDLRNVAA
jgi:membrane-associated protease RseP (regulator of RpoE activity)